MKYSITSISELYKAIILAELEQRIIINSLHRYNEDIYKSIAYVGVIKSILQKNFAYLKYQKKTKLLVFLILTYFNCNNKVELSDSFNFALNTMQKKESEKNNQLIQAIFNVIMKRLAT